MLEISGLPLCKAFDCLTTNAVHRKLIQNNSGCKLELNNKILSEKNKDPVN